MEDKDSRKYRRFFTAEGFVSRLRKLARRFGVQATYSFLLLYYAFRRKETPPWARNIIIGVLGYFLAPLDALPDFTPVVGFTDDLGLLAFGLSTVAAYIDSEVRQKARTTAAKWLGGEDKAAFEAVDNRL